MNPSTVVIIATKGRPREVAVLLEALAAQTTAPDLIIVSACDPGDVVQGEAGQKVQVLYGTPGLPAQRNRALAEVQGRYDIIVFFDDDFIPSRFWIERARDLFSVDPEIAGITGKVLADGVTIGGLDHSHGRSLVEEADSSSGGSVDCKIEDGQSPYGCNMAFRARSIEHIEFDERLVLYGWLEDRDFGFWAAARGRLIWTDRLWGVHLGATRGRTSGLRFGYSQVVNPWYLMKKGSMSPSRACSYILRGIIVNGLRTLRPEPHIDRRGRLKGNIIGIKEIVLGRWAPERIAGM